MWDSNPRAVERPNAFRVRPLQPGLGNLPGCYDKQFFVRKLTPLFLRD